MMFARCNNYNLVKTDSLDPLVKTLRLMAMSSIFVQSPIKKENRNDFFFDMIIWKN